MMIPNLGKCLNIDGMVGCSVDMLDMLDMIAGCCHMCKLSCYVNKLGVALIMNG